MAISRIRRKVRRLHLFVLLFHLLVMMIVHAILFS